MPITCANINCPKRNGKQCKGLRHSKYWSQLTELLEEHFPKGECKERGRAIVMLAFIDMALNDCEKVKKS